MSKSTFLDKARICCDRLTRQAFPEESKAFDDLWKALSPVFDQWLEHKRSTCLFSVKYLSSTPGLGFAQSLDWGLPIALGSVQ